MAEITHWKFNGAQLLQEAALPSACMPWVVDSNMSKSGPYLPGRVQCTRQVMRRAPRLT